jgi:hypothetical protein
VTVSASKLTMTPSERVESYIRDWHECWLRHGGDRWLDWRAGAEVLHSAMECWATDLRKSAGFHWVNGSEDPSASGFGTPPEHDPADEMVRRVFATGSKTVVETVRSENHSPRFREYVLKREHGEWKISKVLSFFGEEGKPVLKDAALEKLLRRPRLRVALPAPERGDTPNCELLFKAGHRFKGSLMSEAEAVRVKSVGKLSLPSGCIVVRDFGYPPDEAKPLSLRVPPGDYAVEVACLSRCIAAVRVVFAKNGRGPFEYRQAVTLGSRCSRVGVDGGNVSISDARAFLSRTKRQHERDYEAWCETSLRRGAKENGAVRLHLGETKFHNAVVVDSGHGDGGYPAFWMFDSSKKLIALVVDFLVAAQFQSQTIRIPWPAGASGEIFNEPKRNGLRVRIDRTNTPSVVASRACVEEIRWVNRDGALVGTNREGGSWSSGNENGWYVDLNKLDHLATEVEIVLYAGFRNA